MLKSSHRLHPTCKLKVWFKNSFRSLRLQADLAEWCLGIHRWDCLSNAHFSYTLRSVCDSATIQKRTFYDLYDMHYGVWHCIGIAGPP